MTNIVNILRGQRLNLTDLISDISEFQLSITANTSGLLIDYSCFGLDINRELSNESYMTFFNQPRTPCGGVILNTSTEKNSNITINLQKLPPTIHRLVIAATVDGNGTMSQLTSGEIRFILNGSETAQFSFIGSDFSEERALMLMEIYRKNGIWRVCAIGQGFSGGLNTLIEYFNGTVADSTSSDLSPSSISIIDEQNSLLKTNINQFDKEQAVQKINSPDYQPVLPASAILNHESDGYQTEENDNKEVTQGTIMKVIDWAYDRSVNGVPELNLESAPEMAKEYLDGDGSLYEKVNLLIRWQILKAGTSGFLTGLGGIITLPVAIPANIVSVIYIQIRMIAAIAYMGGHDLKNDKVKTLVYTCLVGNAAKEIIADVGILVGTKMANQAIRNISGKTITAINQKVGFRLLTKFGQTGAINLGKMVPLVSGLIGGSIDSITTNAIGNIARDIFIEKNEIVINNSLPALEQSLET